MHIFTFLQRITLDSNDWNISTWLNTHIFIHELERIPATESIVDPGEDVSGNLAPSNDR